MEVLSCSFRTLIGVEMQTDLGFELKLVAVCSALKNTVLLGLWIGIKEQQKLFVQKPEHKPENTILTLSYTGAFNAPETPSMMGEKQRADSDCQLEHLMRRNVMTS